jgi:hypothetical protein
MSDLGKASVPAFLDFTNFHLEFVEHSQSSKLAEGCKSCSAISEEDLREIWEALADVVQGSIAKVIHTCSCIG